MMALINGVVKTRYALWEISEWRYKRDKDSPLMKIVGMFSG